MQFRLLWRSPGEQVAAFVRAATGFGPLGCLTACGTFRIPPLVIICTLAGRPLRNTLFLNPAILTFAV